MSYHTPGKIPVILLKRNFDCSCLQRKKKPEVMNKNQIKFITHTQNQIILVERRKACDFELLIGKMLQSEG